MTGLGTLVLLFLVAKGVKPGGMVPASTARKAFKGKSGRTWFVIDRTEKAKTGATVPVRDVFVTQAGQDRVLSFAVMTGGIRAWTFKAPSSLTATAISDFDVSTVQANL